MSQQQSANQNVIAADGQAKFETSTFGFWIYLMTDCVVFATLFAVYAVLHNNTFGGPSTRDLFDMPYVLTETIILLVSSFTCGLAMLALNKHNKRRLMIWLTVTLLLGATFLGMEIYEFRHMVTEGHNWQTSGFLSAYFTLVGTHGLHIAIGLIWIAVMLWLIKKRGITAGNTRRLTSFSLFWHFLDIIWIFIFTFVYLMGVR